MRELLTSFLFFCSPTYQFALANNAILNIDEAGMAKLKKESTECGYEEYLETYLQFPPPKNVRTPITTFVLRTTVC